MKVVWYTCKFESITRRHFLNYKVYINMYIAIAVKTINTHAIDAQTQVVINKHCTVAIMRGKRYCKDIKAY